MNIHPLMPLAIVAAQKAAAAILEIYASSFEVEHKADNSPLTLADQNAHNVIVKELASSQLPILSEEGAHQPYEERSKWSAFWMVDPLDGTKEFVKRNGEFTVNIALIEDGKPVFGVIVVPVSGAVYAGGYGYGSFKYSPANGDSRDAWRTRSAALPLVWDTPFTVVASRSHQTPETEKYMADLIAERGEPHYVSMGSSLKFCVVAEGGAEIYPRLAPTMEWDTAAGQAIVMGVGKEVTDLKTGKPMRYNKENLLNNWFEVK